MNAPLPDAIRQALDRASLDDKYTLPAGRAFMSGIQALVRLPMLQRQRDAAAGLNTAGFISGYRGSPLAATTRTWPRPRSTWTRATSSSSPGVNEELAATRRVGHAAARPVPSNQTL